MLKKTSPAAQELPVRTSRRRAGFSLSQNFKLRFEHHLGPICPKAAFFAYKGIPLALYICVSDVLQCR